MSGTRDVPKERIHLVVSPKTKERLTTMQERLDCQSMTEVLRRAIELLDVVTESQDRGDKLVIERADGSSTELHVVF